MIIGGAQIASSKGDIRENLEKHIDVVKRAVKAGCEFVLFPELSLTGYEPTLADKLAMDIADPRLDGFQRLSNENACAIAVGVPMRMADQVMISSLIFRPGLPRSSYVKQFLHADEFPFFVPIKNKPFTAVNRSTIGLAICYETSVEEHEHEVFKAEIDVYVASVVKTVEGTIKAHARISSLAKKYAVPAVMVNSVGMADGTVCGGRSCAWNTRGQSLGELSADEEALLIVDTGSPAITRITLAK